MVQPGASDGVLWDLLASCSSEHESVVVRVDHNVVAMITTV